MKRSLCELGEHELDLGVRAEVPLVCDAQFDLHYRQESLNLANRKTWVNLFICKTLLLLLVQNRGHFVQKTRCFQAGGLMARLQRKPIRILI